MYSQWVNGIQFRLNKINKIEYQFIAKIRKKETMSITLSKTHCHIWLFCQTLHVLSAKSGGVSVASFATVIDVPVGIISASLTSLLLLVTQLQK